MTTPVKDAIYRIVERLSEREAADLLAYLDGRAADRSSSAQGERPHMLGDGESLEEIKAQLARPRSPEERERALAVLAEVSRHREEMLRRRGGKLFPPSGKILDQLRAERERELP